MHYFFPEKNRCENEFLRYRQAQWLEEADGRTKRSIVLQGSALIEIHSDFIVVAIIKPLVSKSMPYNIDVGDFGEIC